MEFDKNKILTSVTADQAKVGMKGWFGVLPKYIQEIIDSNQEPDILANVDLDSPSPFTRECGYAWPLFYPAPEHTYGERQAQWVRDNNVKEGTRVRVTRAFSDCEYGIAQQWNESMCATVGKVGVVERLLGFMACEGSTKGIRVDFGDCKWWYPYFVLEIVNKQAYRPFNNDELNSLVGKIVVRKCDGNKMLVTGKTNPMKVRLGNDCTYTAQQLLDLFTLDGEPCGVKE